MMKKLMVRFTVTTAISFGLLACGKGFEAKNFGALPISPAVQVKTRAVGDPTDPKTANAYSLDSGEVTKKSIVYTDSVNEVKSAYSEVKGSLKVSNFKFQFDEKTRDLSLRGDLNIGATTEGKPLAFAMHGKMLPQQSTFMAVTDEKSPLVKLLAAKVTCVSEDCKDFLVDFAYKAEQEKAIYVVRVNNITPQEETIERLQDKLQEEVKEVLEAYHDDTKLQEEIADVLEVLDGIMFHKGFSLEKIIALKEAKKEKKGGFEKGLFLESIDYFD